MILCDVGVLLGAYFAQSPHHAACRDALERLRRGADPMAVADIVLAAVVRIGSNPRAFSPPATTAELFGFADALRAGPGAVRVQPGERHWRIFQDLVASAQVRGPDTTDAYLAALAMEHGCEWWTTDAGFARFPGLRWRNLIAGGA